MDFHSDTIDLFKRFPGKTRSRITGSPDQGSVQNESNKLSKLIGMSDGSST